MRAIFSAAASALLLLNISAMAAPAGQSNIAAPEKYTAFAVDISITAPRAKASPVDITINRWSTDAERDRLMSAFREKGQDGLLSLPPSTRCVKPRECSIRQSTVFTQPLSACHLRTLVAAWPSGLRRLT